MDSQGTIAVGAILLLLVTAGLLIARKRKSSPTPRRKSSSGIVLMIGLVFSAVLDPKAKIAAEEIDSQRRKRKTEAGRENE